MTSMPTTMVPQTTGQTPPDTGVWDKGAVAHPLAAIPQVLTSAAGTIQALGLWRGRNAGISVVAALSQSARSIAPRNAGPAERAAEIALMQYLGIAPDEMSLRAIADWEDRSTQSAVVDALRVAAAQMSKLFGVTA
jgi:hypothetical protein